jgi:hypothetical protein
MLQKKTSSFILESSICKIGGVKERSPCKGALSPVGRLEIFRLVDFWRKKRGFFYFSSMRAWSKTHYYTQP